MQPLVEAAYEKYYGKIKFIVVDVTDQNGNELANEMQVNSIPAMFFINKAGQPVETTSGSLTSSDLEEKLNNIL